MTRTGAIAKFRNRVVGIIKFSMLIAFVVIRMATGTIWLVSWGIPGHRFRVSLMALCTIKTPAMVSRVVGGGVHKNVWRPEVGGMACITRPGCLKMARVHSGSRCAIVAAIAGSR